MLPLKKPPLLPFKPRDGFQLDRAIWNWPGFLIKASRAGQQKQFIDQLTKLHGQPIVDQVIMLGRARWEARHTGDE